MEPVFERIQNNIGLYADFPEKSFSPEITGTVVTLHVCILKTRNRQPHQNSARLPIEADEEEVVDLVRTKTGVVQVQRHIDEGRVGRNKNDESVDVGSR